MYKLREPSSQSSTSLTRRSRKLRYRSTNAASLSRSALSLRSAAHTSLHRARRSVAFLSSDAIARATTLLATALLDAYKSPQRLFGFGELSGTLGTNAPAAFNLSNNTSFSAGVPCISRKSVSRMLFLAFGSFFLSITTSPQQLTG
jgi:hypothetical protein